MKKFFARLLCVLLSLQGYPLLALQESGIRAVPDERALGSLDGWLRSAGHKTSIWADSLGGATSRWASSLEEAVSAWSLRPEELVSFAADAADETQGGPASGGSSPPHGDRLEAVRDVEKEVAGRTPKSFEALPRLRLVDKKARAEKATVIDPSAKSSVVAPASTPRQAIPKSGVAPEITALSHSLGDSPGRIFRFVHDEIDFDPKWGAGKSPLGTLLERRGTSWDQAWLLQQLLTAAGVDARFEWGEIEITPELLKNVTGVDDPFRAGDLLTTAGVPIVLLVDGSRVVAARMSHVWVKAFLDYIPNRGATPGPGDKWIRMDPSLKRFDVGAGVRLDEAVPFDLGDYLQSGTLLSPRSFYEEALQSYVDANNVGVAGLEELKPAKGLIQEAFPFVPASLRGKVLTVAGEATEVPATFQQQLEVQVREVGGARLLTWSAPWPAVYGKGLELAWPGATSADQSALDLNGGVFSTPPFEIDLRPVLRVDGAEVVAGEAIGSAEDVELTATLTPPAGSPMLAQLEMYAGEHAALCADFGRIPQEVIDRLTAERDAATDPDEEEGWALALAGAVYLRSLSGDLEHLPALRYRRVVQLGNVVLAAQRGATSRSPDGTPLTFSAAPPSLDLGAMVVGLFPADGVAGAAATSVATLELLGSQGSAREGEALAQALGGEHLTAVGFLTRAARGGQTLTHVDAANVDAALAATELSSEAAASVRAGVERGLVAWISETQLPFDTWDATGYVLEDPATGAGGYFVTFERLVRGLEANSVFHSPQDLDVVTAPIDVVATLEGETIDRWTLVYRAADGGPAVELASGVGPFVNATLAQLDPTLLLNGLYDIVLTARDAAGQTASEKISVLVDGQMKVGDFTLSFVDLVIPVSGLGLEIVRSYDSRARALEDDFGFGWRLEIRQGSYRNNREPGDGWRIEAGFLPCQNIRETKSHLSTIRLADDEIYRFRSRLGSPAPTLGGCFARASFEFVAGLAPGATLQVLGNDQVFWENGSDVLVDIEALELYEPQAVRLTTRDGRIFDLSLTAGVTRLEDPAGNSLVIDQEGITHSTGVALDFSRDPAGRITAIADPMGNSILYTYDPTGDLVGVENRAGESTSFVYSAGHFLETYRNPAGTNGVRADYDDEGRLVRMTDANGKMIELGHHLDARREVISDRLGQVQVMEYDDRGNVIAHIDPLGGVTRRTFDEDGRMLSETDPAGATTTFEFDAAGNRTAITDPLGHVTRFSYDASGRLLTETDPLGRVTTHTYDASSNRTSTSGPDGAIFRTTYDPSGNVLIETGPTGVTTTFTYDGSGNLLTVTEHDGLLSRYTYDPSGNRQSQTLVLDDGEGGTVELVTTFSYDGEGRLTRTVAPDGTVTTTEYDPVGNLVSSTDPLGRETRFGHDATGNQTSIVFPDGSSELRRYDAEGQLTEVVDPDGHSTLYQYDAGGRITRTLFADGSFQELTYDPADRLLGRRDERGFVTIRRYDAAGRELEIEDPLGGVTTFEYDAVGNRSAVTDANGHRARFEYDAADRLVKIVLPDGSERRMAYDAAGRRTEITEPGGQTTRFAYDDRGRLAQVTDPLGAVTRYDYDALDNKIGVTDALDRKTVFEYDTLGRQTAHILPDGSRESFAYDAVGNRIAWSNFSGQTLLLRYDDLNRLVEKAVPGKAPVTFTYTGMGQLATVTDDRGVTRYEWNDRNRLARLTYPDGRELRYQWDATGNRTQMTAAFVDDTLMSVDYAYDAAGRLVGISDPVGGSYSIGYDAAGNRTSLGFPNGVETSYDYDSSNRLRSITTQESGSVLESFDYELDANGRRTREKKADGGERVFTYDAVSRLVGELVRDAMGTTVDERRYTYDAVSNRVREERLHGDGASEAVSFSYDSRDRLTAGNERTYDWDENGNLRQVGAGDGLTLSWDSENRLVGIARSDGVTVLYAYDVGGTLMSLEATAAAGGGTEERRLLVDPTGPVSQVVAETNAAGQLLAFYVRGDDLLGIIRPGDRRYVHSDGLGSVRLLTDVDATVTDRYDYDAFGGLREHVGSDLNPFRFAGEMVDPNVGFYYLRARWMDAEVGRFLSTDLFPGVEHDPVSLHKYLYAAANPVNLVDPTGLFSVGNLVVSSAIIGGLSGAITGFIAGGWVGGVVGLVTGVLLSPIFALLIAGAGYVIAVGAGISVAAGLAISSGLATLLFGYLGVREYINAETPREKTAAAVGLAIMIVSLGVAGVKAPRRITLIGSRRDVLPYSKVPGFEVLQVPDEAWSPFLNQWWLQSGVDRNNAVLVKTNPKAFSQVFTGKFSALLHLELPMLQQQGFRQVWMFMVRWGL